MLLRAKDVYKRVIKLRPNNSIFDARNVMVRYNISRIIIAKSSDTPLGIVTEKDIARYLYINANSESLDNILLEKIMTKDLITVNGQKSIHECASLMLAHKISSLIVTNSDNTLLGIFTKSDLAEMYARSDVDKVQIKEYMIKKVITASPNDLLYSTLLSMNSRGISRIVVTLNDEPIGMITAQDLMYVNTLFGPRGLINLQASKSSRSPPDRKQINIPSDIRRLLIVRDVMRYDPITISSDSYLFRAAQIMTNNRISGIPVVNSIDNLVGIITKTDVIKRLANET
jgi:CBS domain-containing protein